MASDPAPSTSEVDELNKILEVERRLVLRTQENYRALKEKFIGLQEECRVLQKENRTLHTENESLSRWQEDTIEWEDTGRAIIKEFDEANRQREERAKKRDHDTIQELQRVFRKEIADQTAETERQRKFKEELVEENDRLLAEIREMREAERLKEKRQREEEQRLRLQIEQLVRDSEQLCGPERIAYYESTIDALRSSIGKLEEKVTELTRECSRLSSDRTDDLRRFEKALEEERGTTRHLELTSQRISSEYAQLKAYVARKEDQIQELERRVTFLLSEKSSLEVEMVERERGWHKEAHTREQTARAQFAALEAKFQQKCEAVDEVSRTLEDISLLQTRLNDKEARLKQLEEEMSKRNRKDDNEKQKNRKEERDRVEEIQKLKWERDRLEITLAELKKRYETDPETVAEVSRLRTRLAESEAELAKTKEHYRDILKKMKTSLRNLEARHRKTQEKLQSHVLI